MYKLLIMAALLSNAVCAFARKCDPAIPLHMGGPRPEVDLTVGGRTTRAVFDTGAMTTVVNIDQAGQLGVIREGPLAPPFNRAHSASGYQGTLPTFEIGPVALPSKSVAVMDVPLPTSAIISPAVFGDKLVYINFGASTMRTCPVEPRHIPPGTAYPYSKPPFALPSLPILLGTETVEAHLDTGSPINLILPLAYAEKVKLEAPMVEIGRARTHAATMPIYKAVIKGSITVGPVVLMNPEVRFSDVVARPNVGLGILRQLELILEPKASRLWVRKTVANSTST